MSKERIVEIRELLLNLERRIKPLEWDASRHQINEFKLEQLKKLQQDFSSLKAELASLGNK